MLGIIALVPDKWSAMWQARHHLLSHAAAHCPVAWIEPGHHWRSAFGWHRYAEPRHPAVPGLDIRHAARWLPRFHASPRLDAFTVGLRLRAARQSLLARGATHIVLYLWRPEFAPALTLVAHDLSCYHIDDEYSFSMTELEPSGEELALMRQVGQVFIHSRTMLEAKGAVNPHTAYLPNGVDFAAYSGNVAEPADLARIARPRIGYAGWLKPQLDWELLLALARSHPTWSFVFVGPQARRPEVDAPVQQLKAVGNVHFLGGKPTSTLHAYTRHFDVCLMPYATNWYTRFIYPVKVHEYLATGNAVVATALPNLREFAEVVALARYPDEWSAAIARGLSTQGDSTLARLRRAVAERHDWSILARQAIGVLEARLAESGTR